MKVLLGILGLSALLFANNEFKENINYTCLNTQTIKDGKTFQIPEDQAKARPFDFVVNGKKLSTTEKTEFEFKLAKDGMKSYSNDDFILLLQPNMLLGLIPKYEKGKIQYFFRCQSK